MAQDRSKKIEVEVYARNISGDDFEGTLDDVVERLLKWKKEHPNAFIRINYETCGSGYHTETAYTFDLKERRLETDAEFEARIKQEKETADRQQQWKRQQFEQLKKEFGEK